MSSVGLINLTKLERVGSLSQLGFVDNGISLRKVTLVLQLHHADSPDHWHVNK